MTIKIYELQFLSRKDFWQVKVHSLERCYKCYGVCKPWWLLAFVVFYKCNNGVTWVLFCHISLHLSYTRKMLRKADAHWIFCYPLHLPHQNKTILTTRLNAIRKHQAWEVKKTVLHHRLSPQKTREGARNKKGNSRVGVVPYPWEFGYSYPTTRQWIWPEKGSWQHAPNQWATCGRQRAFG